MHSVDGVRVIGNTVFLESSDNVRLSGGSRGAELRNNVFWTEGGFHLNVADDSRVGCFSDYNTLHATGSAKLVHWIVDFPDILDWQEDVHQFDLNSLGTTVVHPFEAQPRFVSAARNDFRVFDVVAGHRRSSPTHNTAD